MKAPGSRDLTFPSMNGIPNSADSHEAEEHHNGIVHGSLSYRQYCRHREQNHLEHDPQQSNDVDNPPQRPSHRPAGIIHIPATVEEGDGDRNAVGHSQRNHADGDEREEGRRGTKVDQAKKHLHKSCLSFSESV